MKKIIIAFLLMINYQLNAQAPILDSANFSPKVGDTLFSWNGLINNYFNPGNQGANVFWDFSNINFTIPISNPSDLITSHLEYYNDQNCNFIRIYDPIASVPGTCEYRYFITSAIMSDNGSACYGSNGGAENYYNPNIILFTFPFTYLSSISDSVVNNFSSSTGYSDHKHVNYSREADAWGILKIGNVIHDNTLRIKSITSIYDYSNSILLTLDTSYTWYKPYCSTYLLQMSSSWSDYNGGWTNTKKSFITPYGFDFANYFNTFTPIIYPNPATDYIYIDNIAEKARIEIYKMDGMLQQSTDVNGNSMINIRNLPDGLYLVKIQTDKGVTVKKFFKK